MTDAGAAAGHRPTVVPDRPGEAAGGRSGRYGDFGGRYVPEALIAALEQLDEARLEARSDETFQSELARLHTTYTGRPSPLTEVARTPLAAAVTATFPLTEEASTSSRTVPPTCTLPLTEPAFTCSVCPSNSTLPLRDSAITSRGLPATVSSDPTRMPLRRCGRRRPYYRESVSSPGEPMTPSAADRRAKQLRLQTLRESLGAGPLLLTSHEAIAWYLDGPRPHVSLAGPPVLAVRAGATLALPRTTTAQQLAKAIALVAGR